MLPKGSSQRVCAPKDNVLHPRCGSCFMHLQQCATVSKVSLASMARDNMQMMHEVLRRNTLVCSVPEGESPDQRGSGQHLGEAHASQEAG